MAKILRKFLENRDAQFPKVSVFIGQSRYFVIIAFKMLEMEFKIKYKILIANV